LISKTKIIIRRRIKKKKVKGEKVKKEKVKKVTKGEIRILI